ncbi:MAG: DUF1080 domain-containing protein [Verrucomicrobiota bacterium]
MYRLILPLYVFCFVSLSARAEEGVWKSLFNGRDLSGWVDVNTSPETWFAEDGILKCKGLPIGVMRSERQYENFIMEIEWMHREPGGNSGVFIWSEGVPFDHRRLPKGVEVQMLELEWPEIHNRDPAYVSGELFGSFGLEVVPENPRGTRSKSKEFRCKGKGEWNQYVIVAVDGVVKLSINGKFVNGIREAERRKGYLCLESEGAPVWFRNIRIMELPSSGASGEQVAPVVEN